MTLTEIESLSVELLKTNRVALTEAAAQAEVGELAQRYIKARTDAAMRDEKLAEQGVTIATLNETLADVRRANQQLTSHIAKTKAETDSQIDSLKRESAALQAAADERIGELEVDKETFIEQRDAMTATAAKWEQLAKARRLALADVLGTVNTITTQVGSLLVDEG